MPVYRFHVPDLIQMGFGRRDKRVGPGVYLLFDGDELVYVGQAVNMLSRFAIHASGKPPVKEFDNAFFFPMPEQDIGWCEAVVIQFTRPRDNKIVPVRYVWKKPPYGVSDEALYLVKLAERKVMCLSDLQPDTVYNLDHFVLPSGR